jgi:hypothetical protein
MYIYLLKSRGNELCFFKTSGNVLLPSNTGKFDIPDSCGNETKLNVLYI